MGRFRFLLFYLGCGVAAGAVHWLSDPASTVPTIGASGAIAGVLGAYLRWYPGAKVLTLVPILIYPLFVDLPAVVFLGLWFVTQIFSGAMSIGASGAADAGGVAWWAHVGGFVAGFALCGLVAGRAPDQIPGRVRHHTFPDRHPRLPVRPADWP
jgi:membrane associated rhomboid family serine protease